MAIELVIDLLWPGKVVRQSNGSGFKSRFGQIAYFHGVKTLSTLGTGDVPRGSENPRRTVGPVSDKIWGT